MYGTVRARTRDDDFHTLHTIRIYLTGSLFHIHIYNKIWLFMFISKLYTSVCQCGFIQFGFIYFLEFYRFAYLHELLSH